MYLSNISITFDADSDAYYGMEWANGEPTVSRNPSGEHEETKPAVHNLVPSLERLFGNPRNLLSCTWSFVKVLF